MTSNEKQNLNITPEGRQPLDMASERQNSTLNPDSLSILFAGSREARDQSRFLFSLLKSKSDSSTSTTSSRTSTSTLPQPSAFSKDLLPFQSRSDRFFCGQKTAVEYIKLRNREGLNKSDRDKLRLLTDVYLSVQVHESMGHPTLMNQSDHDQWNQWKDDVVNARWIVAYAQTEIAHGSHLNGLRTTATLTQDGQQWIINTPELSAGKAWIGGAGLSATHAVVLANLVIKEKEYGMHPFLVPLRSLQDHTLLPGRQIIDMGPKYGVPSMDNGCLWFNQVSIPRTNLLLKFQSVSSSGEYKLHNQSSKILTRGTMTLVRVGLCEIAALHLSRACLISIRYACVRRQGKAVKSFNQNNGKEELLLEPQILDYPSVQNRLFTALSTSWALTILGRHLRSIYNGMIQELQETGKSDLLPIVHGFTSVLKPTATLLSVEGIERCRRSMGGHGYSKASGFEFASDQPLAGLTYEGDTYLLLSGPAANFLVKQFNQSKKPDPILSELHFLKSKKNSFVELKSEEDFLDGENQLQILGTIVLKLSEELSEIRESKKNIKDKIELKVLDHLDNSISIRTSLTYGSYLILFSFNSYLFKISKNLKDFISSKNKDFFSSTSFSIHLESLKILRSIFSIETCFLTLHLSELLNYSILSTSQISILRLISSKLMIQLRPNALLLSEACDLDDEYLSSPLGSRDGQAYERFVGWMRKDPLNQTGANGGRDENGVVKGYHEGIGKLIRGQVENFDEGMEKRNRGSRL